ncbi:hypothetical protein ACWGCW_35245 [Streptomyces sp. NPDC054933]
MSFRTAQHPDGHGERSCRIATATVSPQVTPGEGILEHYGLRPRRRMVRARRQKA